MSINKYVGDYHLTEEFDGKGRIHHTLSYIGKPYFFDAEPDEVIRGRKRLIVMCAAAFAVYLAAMVPASDMMHYFYVSLPFAFCAVPLFLLIKTLLSVPATAQKLAQPLERRQADRISNSIPQYSVFLMVLAAGALAGTAIAWIRNIIAGDDPGTVMTDRFSGNLVFTAMASALAVLAVMIFRKRSVLSVHEQEVISGQDD